MFTTLHTKVRVRDVSGFLWLRGATRLAFTVQSLCPRRSLFERHPLRHPQPGHAPFAHFFLLQTLRQRSGFFALLFSLLSLLEEKKRVE